MNPRSSKAAASASPLHKFTRGECGLFMSATGAVATLPCKSLGARTASNRTARGRRSMCARGRRCESDASHRLCGSNCMGIGLLSLISLVFLASFCQNAGRKNYLYEHKYKQELCLRRAAEFASLVPPYDGGVAEAGRFCLTRRHGRHFLSPVSYYSDCDLSRAPSWLRANPSS
jgi:hypothetical protein